MKHVTSSCASASVPTTTHYLRLKTLAAANAVITHLGHILLSQPSCNLYLAARWELSGSWMACVDIVKDTREDITRFMFDSYVWRSRGGGRSGRHWHLEAVAQYPANMWGCSLNSDGQQHHPQQTDVVVKYEFRPNGVLPYTRTFTHTRSLSSLSRLPGYQISMVV